MFSRKDYFAIAILVVFIILCWSPAVKTPFINDDFQIIGYHNPESFGDCFAPFYKKDVSLVYWRPIPNTIQSLTLWAFGISAFPLRIENLIFYILTCLALYLFLRKLKISPLISFFSTLLFSSLTSHELHVAWIAGRGDVLAAFFILVSAIALLPSGSSGKGKYIIASFAFLAALLTKEIAFAGVFIPLLMIFLNKENKKICFILFSIFTVISLLVFVGRSYFIGGSPLQSSNFDVISLKTIAYNFFLSIPLSVFSPDILEQAYSKDILNLSLFLIPLMIILFLFYFFFASRGKKNYSLLLFAILWFLVFIAPALPMLMRWYPFVASIGLIIIFSVLLDSLSVRLLKIFLPACAIVVLSFGLYDYNLMLNWNIAGEKVAHALNSLKKIDFSRYDTVTIWAAPDKINRINALKNGIQQAVHYYSGQKHTDVNSFLRGEFDSASGLHYTYFSDSSFTVKANKARFLLDEGKSRSVITNEDILEYTPDFNITIHNNEYESTAHVKFKSGNPKNLNLYFNGTIFKTPLQGLHL